MIQAQILRHLFGIGDGRIDRFLIPSKGGGGIWEPIIMFEVKTLHDCLQSALLQILLQLQYKPLVTALKKL